MGSIIPTEFIFIGNFPGGITTTIPPGGREPWHRLVTSFSQFCKCCTRLLRSGQTISFRGRHFQTLSQQTNPKISLFLFAKLYDNLETYYLSSGNKIKVLLYTFGLIFSKFSAAETTTAAFRSGIFGSIFFCLNRKKIAHDMRILWTVWCDIRIIIQQKQKNKEEQNKDKVSITLIVFSELAFALWNGTVRYLQSILF